MSTRRDDSHKSTAEIQQGYSIPDDLDVPSCTIEDVDRSLFDLFDKQLPFNYGHQSGQRRAPVIFATGERFAVLRRKEPLRDKAGALILPLISIMRTGVTQSPTMGAGTNQNAPLTVKTRLSPKDPIYQRLINKQGFLNSDNLASRANAQFQNPLTGSLPGKVATRRPSMEKTMDTLHDRVLEPDLKRNIFEVITMPPPKYYAAAYEVTFWTQYTVQMNDMIMALMSLYQAYSQRAFRLETPKGYWFVGYIDDALSPGNNFDDFTDSERMVRYSFTVNVPAYIVGSAFGGSQNVLRKYVSAPDLSFTGEIFNLEAYANNPPANIPSGDSTAYILDDVRSIGDPPPGQAIAHPYAPDSLRSQPVADVGGAETRSDVKTVKIEENPFTGEERTRKVFVKSRNRRSGETVLKIDIYSE